MLLVKVLVLHFFFVFLDWPLNLVDEMGYKSNLESEVKTLPRDQKCVS